MKKKRLFALLLSVSFITSAFLTGCSSSDQNASTSGSASDTEANQVSDKETEATESATPQYFNTYLESEPGTLDQTKASDTYANDILVNITERLTRIEPNEDGVAEPAPAGAERWDISADGLVYTFYLRENKWSDGEPITAMDYEYAIKRGANPETGSTTAYFLEPIKNYTKVEDGTLPVAELGVKALDDMTLEITLEEVTPYFLSITNRPIMAPLRQDFVEAQGEKHGSEGDAVLSSGPFTVASWVHNSEIVLVKNENYWDKDSVNLETATFKIIDDVNAQSNSFENGSLDTILTTQEEWIERFDTKADARFEPIVTAQVVFSFFNHKDELFGNANIRKAFIIALDRDDYNEAVWSDRSTPAYGWIPRGLVVEGKEYRSEIAGPIEQLIEENPDPKALLLKGMEELGLGDDPSTLKIVWDFGATSQRMKTIAEYFQQALKDSLGVNIEVQLNEWPMFQEKTKQGDFQIGYMGWGAEYNDPHSMSSLLITGTGAIDTGWSNERYDELVRQAGSEQDPEKRMELYKEAEYLMQYEEGVLNPLLYTTQNRFTYNYVKNFYPYPFMGAGLKYIDTSARP